MRVSIELRPEENGYTGETDRIARNRSIYNAALPCVMLNGAPRTSRGLCRPEARSRNL